jgi:hypothetical protein
VPVPGSGAVLIQNNGPNTVVAFIQPDGTGMKLQMLSIAAREPFEQNPVSLYVANGTVSRHDSFITISDAVRRLEIIFALSEATVLPPVDGYTQTVLRGYSLGYRLGIEGHTIESVKRDPVIAAALCDLSLTGEDECLPRDVHRTETH